MLASASWLAGRDELIAPSPVSRQVSRLEGVTPAVQAAGFFGGVLGLPTLSLLAGIVVWMVRR
jgi:hypothetical protein